MSTDSMVPTGAQRDAIKRGSLTAARVSYVAAYGSVGGEVGVGRVHLRLEVRDYLSGFKPLGGGGSADTRNDVVALAGLSFSKR